MLYFVGNDFKITNINPFTGNPYDDTWLVYELTDSANYEYYCGNSNGFVYCIKASRINSNWQMSLGDFIDFNNDKNLILIIGENDYDEHKLIYNNHRSNDNYLREYESKIIVHSTTYENWTAIQNEQCLKSYNSISDNKEKAIGEMLGDPVDFKNYIMFGTGGVSGEIVVASKQNGKITMDINAPYKTGARLYFDAKKIAEDGLLIRDGIHLKVKDKLLLKPYLLWTATWNNIELKSNISTPKEFTERANEKFYELFGEYKYD